MEKPPHDSDIWEVFQSLGAYINSLLYLLMYQFWIIVFNDGMMEGQPIMCGPMGKHLPRL